MIEARLLHQDRRHATYAITETRIGRAMRSEVIVRRKDGSAFCRACRMVDACGHVSAVRRIMSALRIVQ